MLRQLTIENFLSFHRRQTLGIEGLRLLVGANGAGKTNIFRIITFILETWNYSKVPQHPGASWNPEKPVHLELEFDLSRDEEELSDWLSLRLLAPGKQEHIIGTASDILAVREKLKMALKSQKLFHCFQVGLVGTPDDENLQGYATFSLPQTQETNKRILLWFGGASTIDQFIVIPWSDNPNEIFQTLSRAISMPQEGTWACQQIQQAHEDAGIEEPVLSENIWRLKVSIAAQMISWLRKSTPELRFAISRLEQWMKEVLGIEFPWRVSPKLLSHLLRFRTCHVPEDRGVLRNTSVLFHRRDSPRFLHLIPKMLANRLFWMTQRDELAACQAIRKHFKHFFFLDDWKYSVKLEKHPDRQNRHPASPEHISGKAILRFTRRGGPPRAMEEVPGGVWDVLLILTALFDDQFSTVLLDEPSKSLHPSMAPTLRQVFHQVCNIQKRSVLAITHSPSLVMEILVPKTTVCIDAAEGTRMQSLGFAEVPTLKWLCDPIRAGMVFARGILFVEGEAEQRFLMALFDELDGQLCDEMKGFQRARLVWDLVRLEGKENCRHGIRVTKRLLLPTFFLLDWDALVNDKQKTKHEPLPKKVKGKEKVHQPNPVRILELEDIWEKRKGWVAARLLKQLKCKAEENPYSQPDIPETDLRLRDAVFKTSRNRIFCWRKNNDITVHPNPNLGKAIRDIEGVSGMEKGDWRKKNFGDLREHVKLLLTSALPGTAKGAIDELVVLLQHLKECGAIYIPNME